MLMPLTVLAEIQVIVSCLSTEAPLTVHLGHNWISISVGGVVETIDLNFGNIVVVYGVLSVHMGKLYNMCQTQNERY